MPRAPRPWFRFYVEALHDWKLRRLSPAERWLWVAILTFARESCIAGYLMVSEWHALADDELASYADVPLKLVQKALPKMVDFGMIERDENLGAWHVNNWDRRQFESDDVTARTSKHRSKELDRNVPSPFVGTGNSESVSVIEKQSTDRRRAETFIPEDFSLSAEMRSYARDKGFGYLDLDTELDKFINHAHQNDRKCRDWISAWRNWVINAAKRTPKPAAEQSIPALRMTDEQRAAL